MLIDIYCDESRQDLLVNRANVNTNNRYVCFGGIWVPNEKRALIKQQINEIRQKHGIHGEFKWGNVSNSKRAFYRELIDLFFRSENDDIYFRCVVIDALEVDNEQFNDSDQELGYYKFYYQLLHNWLTESNDYYIFTDFKTNKDRCRLNELRRITNLGMHGDRIKLIQAIDSKESVILQLQNILMGTVAYKFNFGSDGQSETKKELVSLVEKYLEQEIALMYKNEQKRFNIFKISLRGGRR
ncbi:MAG: DUF3800 domain-containing protein [Lachnospiraceae bacterium]|nr:DUF3800 domain-containing protein [Lachnospiraceae bacterium]